MQEYGYQWDPHPIEGSEILNKTDFNDVTLKEHTHSNS